jgi:hypothetical protein
MEAELHGCPSSKELSAAEVEAQIRKVLDLGVIQTPSASPIPLWSGITSVRFCTFSQFLWHSRFYLFTVLVILRRVLGAAVASCRMLIYPWMPQGGR